MTYPSIKNKTPPAISPGKNKISQIIIIWKKPPIPLQSLSNHSTTNISQTKTYITSGNQAKKLSAPNLNILRYAHSNTFTPKNVPIPIIYPNGGRKTLKCLQKHTTLKRNHN